MRLVEKSRFRYLAAELKYLGSNVDIDFDTVFVNPSKISISDESRIFKGVYMKSRALETHGIRIGRGVKIHEYTYIDDYGGEIFLDDYCGIGQHCVIGGHGKLYVGKYSMIAGLTYIVPANHVFKSMESPYVKQGETKKGVYIGDNVWIGSGCVILDGVKIGDNAVIGAGSVVSKSIPANTLAFGIPAKPVRKLHSE